MFISPSDLLAKAPYSSSRSWHSLYLILKVCLNALNSMSPVLKGMSSFLDLIMSRQSSNECSVVLILRKLLTKRRNGQASYRTIDQNRHVITLQTSAGHCWQTRWRLSSRAHWDCRLAKTEEKRMRFQLSYKSKATCTHSLPWSPSCCWDEPAWEIRVW